MAATSEVTSCGPGRPPPPPDNPPDRRASVRPRWTQPGTVLLALIVLTLTVAQLGPVHGEKTKTSPALGAGYHFRFRHHPHHSILVILVRLASPRKNRKPARTALEQVQLSCYLRSERSQGKVGLHSQPDNRGFGHPASSELFTSWANGNPVRVAPAPKGSCSVFFCLSSAFRSLLFHCFPATNWGPTM
ncbi:anti-FecI sigma factor FecR [Anopheles sinensis]|uniref:Anti-FecI sigma factor FecR n=1 Tax=Anopheles sinensis TaxID=74873 RepID=A0A084WHX8_ANOSI|nr:anti-FecI sigma factor FecR [Anopheles sinensis]